LQVREENVYAQRTRNVQVPARRVPVRSKRVGSGENESGVPRARRRHFPQV